MTVDKPLSLKKFLALLREVGHEASPADVVKAGVAYWANLPDPVRYDILAALGLEGVEPESVTFKIGKKPGAPITLDNVIVLLRAPTSDDAPIPINLPPRENRPADAPGTGLVAADEPAPAEAPQADLFPVLVDEDTEEEYALEEASPAEIAEALDLLPDLHEEGETGHEDVSGLPVLIEPDDVHEDAEAPKAGREKPPAPKSDGIWVLPREQVESPAAPVPAEAEAAVPAETAPPVEDAEAGKGKKLLGALFKKAEKAEEAIDPESLGEITPIPPITDPNFEQVEVYPVQEPYAFVRILYDKENHEHFYEVIEPPLSDREKNVLAFIEDTLVDVIDVGLSAVTPEEAANMLRKHVDEIMYDYSVLLSPISKEKLLYYILRDFLGFGKLDPIMRDEMIEDVSCDGPRIPIFLYHRKYESIKSNVHFVDDNEADSYVIKMAQRSGKHISIAEPLLDATLPDGSRLNATLSDEVTANGSTFTIRKFKEDPFTAPDLVRFGTMSAEMLAYWWIAVQNGASAIYAGGTASGKTTSLNAILLFIPPQMKIVSIEDTREVNLPHENWIPGVTRSGYGPRDAQGRQAGEIDMFSLLKAALRQRPEYILVGEVRGQEAYALFQAMATGHTAYGTMHADSVESVIHRLESEPISIPRSLLEALDIVSVQVQTRIGERRVRRTKQLTEVVGLDPHTREILTNEVFTWNPARDEFEFSGVSYVLERVQMERNLSEFEMRQEMRRRKEVIEWMVAKKIHDYRDVGKVITSYYKDRDALMERIRREMEELRTGEASGPEAPDKAAPAQEAPAQEEARAEPTSLAVTPSGSGSAETDDSADRLRQLREEYEQALAIADDPGALEDADWDDDVDDAEESTEVWDPEPEHNAEDEAR